MLIKIKNSFINIDHVVTARSDRDVVFVSMAGGSTQEFDGQDGDYLRTILEAIAYTDVRTLNDQLPGTKKTSQEF